MRTIGLLLFLISLTSCSTTEPPDNPEPVLKLELEDVSCTEAWITLTTVNLPLPTTLNLLKDNNVTKTINLQTADTLLYIDSLLPNQTYKFQVSSIQSTAGGLLCSIQYQVSSNELSVTTMDTTSHNFTWQTWTFGEHSSSTLYDVAIVNENCIWVVGEIYMYDSLGNPDPNAYNAVHWDGQKWELKRIKTYSSCDPVDFSSIRSVVAFQSNNIVFMTGGSIIKYDGINYNIDCTIRPLLTGRLNKLWGNSSSDLYAVGNEGNIAYWNGVKWTKIESGTTLPIQAIWGSTNNKGEQEINCVASDKVLNNGNKVLQIIDGKVTELNNTGLPWSLSSIWFKAGIKYYIVGDGIYTNWSTVREWNKEDIPPLLYKHTIYGSAVNDIIIAGAYGLVLHYNGYRWTHLMGDLSNYSNHLSAKIKDGTFVVVGMQVGTGGYQAKIIMGK